MVLAGNEGRAEESLDDLVDYPKAIRRIMASMLLIHVRDFLNNNSDYNYRQAKAWIDGNGSNIFSFKNVCNYIGYSPQFTRERLYKLKEEGLKADKYSLT